MKTKMQGIVKIIIESVDSRDNLETNVENKIIL